VTNDKTPRSKTGRNNQRLKERDRHVIVLTMESLTNRTSFIDKVKKINGKTRHHERIGLIRWYQILDLAIDWNIQ